MAKMSRSKILELIIKGLNKAQKKYLNWTKDNEGISYGAEYILTTYVAESIGNSEEIGSLHIEKPIKELFIESEKEIQNSNDECRTTGKADIAIYLKNKLPLAIIEVKNNVDKIKKIALDIHRISCLIEQKVIEYGVVAFISEFEEKDLTIDDIEKQIINLIKENDLKELKYKYRIEIFSPSKSYEEYYWSWSSVSILFYK